jgi:hypothetical protein
VIFYAIYKKQQNHYTIGVALLQERPWEDFYFCNVGPGARQRTVRRNWASSPALAAGEGAGEGPWATGERFGCLDGVEAARAAGCAGG